jgi:hypothetical protein
MFFFPPGWWGWLLERLLAGQCHRGVAESLARIKKAAESPV